jgi:CBS domain containing-hemolysin-like protein
MEDIIETLLGVEIMDEYDSTEDLQQFARKNWQKRAKKLGIISEDDDKDIIK